MRNHTIIWFLAACALLALAGTAFAKNVTIMIPMREVTARSDEHGDYYVVKFDLPSDLSGKRLDTALLEFVVDATPLTAAEAEATPLVAVFPLTEAPTGVSTKYDSEVPSVRPVSMGENQTVMADITDIVKGWLASPASNHGLVIGALTGPEVGTVLLKDARLGLGVALRVTLFYQNRSGERVSQ